LLVGEALACRDGMVSETWGRGSSPGETARKLRVPRAAVQEAERFLEAVVSRIIGTMPFVFVRVDDPPSAGSARAVIERNAISLLSNFAKDAIDPPSSAWLGHHSGHERVRASGLWNNEHVDEEYDPTFLDVLARACSNTIGARSTALLSKASPAR